MVHSSGRTFHRDYHISARRETYRSRSCTRDLGSMAGAGHITRLALYKKDHMHDHVHEGYHLQYHPHLHPSERGVVQQRDVSSDCHTRIL